MDGKRAMGHEIGGCPKEESERAESIALCPHPEDKRHTTEKGQIGCLECDAWLEDDQL